MAKGQNANTVLILDDEPEYLQWVEEFLATKGLTVRYARTLTDGKRELELGVFRLLLVDMNVPGAETILPSMLDKYPILRKYPGIALAIEARNRGYGAHSVIAYSVHDDALADKQLAKLHCRYVLKGRPQIFKSVVESSLAPPEPGSKKAR